MHPSIKYGGMGTNLREEVAVHLVAHAQHPALLEPPARTGVRQGERHGREEDGGPLRTRIWRKEPTQGTTTRNHHKESTQETTAREHLLNVCTRCFIVRPASSARNTSMRLRPAPASARQADAQWERGGGRVLVNPLVKSLTKREVTHRPLGSVPSSGSQRASSAFQL